MTKNTLDALRNHLFVTLEGLTDTEEKIDLGRVKAINETAQTIINSAKVEVQFLNVTGQGRAGTFFEQRSGANRLNGKGTNGSQPILSADENR